MRTPARRRRRMPPAARARCPSSQRNSGSTECTIGAAGRAELGTDDRDQRARRRSCRRRPGGRVDRRRPAGRRRERLRVEVLAEPGRGPEPVAHRAVPGVAEAVDRLGGPHRARSRGAGRRRRPRRRGRRGPRSARIGVVNATPRLAAVLGRGQGRGRRPGRSTPPRAVSESVLGPVDVDGADERRLDRARRRATASSIVGAGRLERAGHGVHQGHLVERGEAPTASRRRPPRRRRRWRARAGGRMRHRPEAGRGRRGRGTTTGGSAARRRAGGRRRSSCRRGGPASAAAPVEHQPERARAPASRPGSGR